jgi:LacI family transcriptional regulator
MKDVAERCGVSETTVSHVVNRTRRVAPETRRRVLDAIRELGFYTNAHARRLARGSSDFLGLVISDIENPFFPEVIKSFENAALKRGFEILLCTTNYDPKRTRAAMRKLIENKVQGVAIMTSQIGAEEAVDLAANGVAAVFLNSAQARPYCSYVAIDHAQGAREAIDYLRGLGHKRFGFIQGPSNRPSALMARKAVADALGQCGCEAVYVEGENTLESGAAAVRDLIDTQRLPSALLCDNDLCALGAIGALTEAGIGVPGGVSVVGADDIPFARLASPPLTTIRIPRDLIGELAFAALDKMLRSKRHAGVEYRVETSLVIRQSTGKAVLTGCAAGS